MLRGVLVVLACVVTTPTSAQCEVSGRLTDTRVAVADGFAIRVRRAVVRARPRSNGDAEVHVESSLVFDGVATELPWFIQSRVDVERGMLSLTRSIPLDHVRAAGDDVRAGIQLNPWARIRSVTLPCRSIVVGRSQTEEASTLRNDVPFIGSHLLRPRGRVLRVHATPDPDGHRLVVRLGRSATFTFRPIDRREGWIRIEWTDGINRLRGWVRSEHVRPSDGHGWGSTGGFGTLGCAPHGRSIVPGGYEGVADVDSGTPVHTSPGGRTWATVARGRFVVRFGPNDEYAAIIEAAFLSEGDQCSLQHAFVPRAAVHPRASSGPP